MFEMENNKLNSAYIELEVFVGHWNGDVPRTLTNKKLELIRTKVSSVWLHTNDH